MRIDDFLSTVGIVKRRSVAKQVGASGMIEVNGRVVKPAYQVKVRDIIVIKGSKPFRAEVLVVPTGSVPKASRSEFFKEL
ncbi:MAG TPA: S4 domain-containing protein [Acidobacteriota bacterium]|nr:S4 domain-containing protein [Acidobacteriota bacterium]